MTGEILAIHRKSGLQNIFKMILNTSWDWHKKCMGKFQRSSAVLYVSRPIKAHRTETQDKSYMHKLNIELDLHVHRALLVSQDRRHVFVTSCI